MNKKQIIAVTTLVAALAITGVYGVQTASAATETNDFPPMVQKMVEKFNLNTDEVSKLMTEDRDARQAERKADFESKLAEAVIAGKITEAQKSAIIAKHDELDAKRDALREQNQGNREAMRSQMESLRTEMQEFLKTQGIDESVMPTPNGPMGDGEHMGGGMHRGQNS